MVHYAIVLKSQVPNPNYFSGVIVFKGYLYSFSLLFFVFSFAACNKPPAADPVHNQETVVLLHGLARSGKSLFFMASALEKAGYTTCKISYPSTEYAIAVLASDYIKPEMEKCLADGDQRVSFITHSMGGILVRYMVEQGWISDLGRVVMLSPPNQGSEIVDKLGELWLFEWLNGPAGKELGTDSLSMPNRLSAAEFELGVITGSKSLNPVFSDMIAGDDDGKVSIESAKVEGMNDFLVLPVSHTFIMQDREVIRQSLYFLEHGKFDSILP